MLLRRYHKVEEVEVVEEVKKINIEPTIVEDDLNLEGLSVKELKQIALERQIEVPDRIKKVDLIQLIREG
ncbi:MAG TPA: hypothetical protein GXZ59_05680 [Clostridiaceae bacterium]|nr:hypothetical protein [Clostridiaceae bacterium]